MNAPTNAAEPEEASPDPAVLRAEHDALGRRLEVRVSIDAAKIAVQHLFVGLICVGLTVKLAWDRWGVLKPGVVRKAHPGAPVFLLIAGAATLVLLGLAVRSLLRARRLMRNEDRLFARYKLLRDRLGLDR